MTPQTTPPAPEYLLSKEFLTTDIGCVCVGLTCLCDKLKDKPGDARCEEISLTRYFS